MAIFSIPHQKIQRVPLSHQNESSHQDETPRGSEMKNYLKHHNYEVEYNIIKEGGTMIWDWRRLHQADKKDGKKSAGHHTKQLSDLQHGPKTTAATTLLECCHPSNPHDGEVDRRLNLDATFHLRRGSSEDSMIALADEMEFHGMGGHEAK